VITGNGAVDGQGGGIFINGRPEDVVVHKNTILGRNFPDDLVIRPDPGCLDPSASSILNNV
jgi:hypothetical protein